VSGLRTGGARPRVAIVDYEMGNLFSVARACEAGGMVPHLAPTPDLVRDADAVILPGVGGMPHAMTVLRATGLADAILEAADRSTPMLAVCLGMQLLMARGTENSEHEGLGLVAGDVVRFDGHDATGTRLRVPHIGWNTVTRTGAAAGREADLLGAVPDGTHFYFVHSYYVRPTDASVIAGLTSYGDVTFCSALVSGNVMACQFHPERSGPRGLQVYSAFGRAVAAGRTMQVND